MGPPDSRPAETGAGHGPVPANSLQGYSGRRRRDASVLDADTLQDPIVAAGRTWKLIPLTDIEGLHGAHHVSSAAAWRLSFLRAFESWPSAKNSTRSATV